MDTELISRHMESYLHIYPTSRAIRALKEEYVDSNSLMRQVATIAEFEQKALLLGNRSLVDSAIRAILLRESANFSEFSNLKSDLNLLKFYTKADDFFRFFEEVSAESVTIDELYLADSYAEFERDLQILQKLLDNYKSKLDNLNLIDKIFIPKEYRLNSAYINSFDGFVLELEGYLTKFELELIVSISKIKPFIIRLRSTKYNLKMLNSFKELGINLPINCEVEFNLSTKEIIKSTPLELEINSEVIETSERLEQIAIAYAKVEEFVQSGIKPERIAIILPDESMAPILKSYDKLANLNLAMGDAYRNHSSYLILEELYKAVSGDSFAIEYLIRNSIDYNKFREIFELKMGVTSFFEYLKEFGLPLYSSEDFAKELDKLALSEIFFKFNRVFTLGEFSFKEWLFLWLNRLKKHSIDNIGGGKVTVMGLLESRGVGFDGVVIIDFNDGFIPSVSNKDRFLNSSVRAHAKLPTKEDRENLQKYYYARVLERAKKSVVIYQKSDTTMPSKFLYELELDGDVNRYKVPYELMYNLDTKYNAKSYERDLEVEFNAKDFTWSATMLKSFLECKRKFYYRYIKSLKEPESSEVNEGRELHNILSKVIVPNRVYNSVDELKKEFLIKLANVGGDVELLYKKPLWVKMLEPTFKQTIEHFKSGYRVQSVEFALSGIIGGLKFRGVVDRLDRKDNLNLIIDYKSGSIKAAMHKDVEKLNDFQMNIYAKLFDRAGTNFAFLELFNGNLSYLDEFEAKEQKLMEHIEYISTIKSFSATRCENLQSCRYCPYILMCHRGEYL
jgi:RecB family exonuclease